MKKLIAALVIIGLLFSAAGYVYIQQILAMPGPLGTDKPVYIEPGTPVKAIAAQLNTEGVIDAPFIFEIGAQMTRAAGGLQAGEYLFTAHMTPAGAMALLRSGKTYQRKVTIAEGLMSVEIVDVINNAEAMTGKIDTVPPEGTLLPETYNYSHGDNRQTIIDRMTKAMTATVAELWEKRAQGLPVHTPSEAVTLASIVERETGLAAERPRVAGVFVNRLNALMPLQSDPTVIYAVTMGKYKLDRPLNRKDLETASPYNTYLNPGLPPNPIANPGRASISAVLNPEANEFIYFVADGTGGHAFAKTLEEHSRNVGKWREIEKNSK